MWIPLREKVFSLMRLASRLCGDLSGALRARFDGEGHLPRPLGLSSLQF